MRYTDTWGDRIERSFSALRWATHSDHFINHVVEVLGEAASVSAGRLVVLERRLADLETECDPGDPYDLEYEEELLETVLGSMFVAWQVFLSTMISAVLDLDSHCRSELKLRLSIAQGKAPRRGILRFGTPAVGKTGHTGPEIIDAFANYFKHRDEWPNDWRSLTHSKGAYTAGIIHSCGARDNSQKNLRLGIQKLGVKMPYNDFTSISKCLIGWVSKIEPQLRSEIESADSRYKGRL